jgi:hypothetical protein
MTTYLLLNNVIIDIIDIDSDNIDLFEIIKNKIGFMKEQYKQYILYESDKDKDIIKINIRNDKLKNGIFKYIYDDIMINGFENFKFIDNNIDDIKIDKFIIEKTNNKSIELFKNKDFKKLINIYHNNKKIYLEFLKYIESGDIISDCIDSDDEDNNNDYKKEFNILKSLNSKFDDNIINNTLIKTKGHLNLSLRKILNDDCI